VLAHHYQEKAIEKTILRILGSCTFLHSQGQKLPWRPRSPTSAIPPKVDSRRTSGHVCFVPIVT